MNRKKKCLRNNAQPHSLASLKGASHVNVCLLSAITWLVAWVLFIQRETWPSITQEARLTHPELPPIVTPLPQKPAAAWDTQALAGYRAPIMVEPWQHKRKGINSERKEMCNKMMNLFRDVLVLQLAYTQNQ